MNGAWTHDYVHRLGVFLGQHLVEVLVGPGDVPALGRFSSLVRQQVTQRDEVHVWEAGERGVVAPVGLLAGAEKCDAYLFQAHRFASLAASGSQRRRSWRAVSGRSRR